MNRHNSMKLLTAVALLAGAAPFFMRAPARKLSDTERYYSPVGVTIIKTATRGAIFRVNPRHAVRPLVDNISGYMVEGEIHQLGTASLEQFRELLLDKKTVVPSLTGGLEGLCGGFHPGVGLRLWDPGQSEPLQVLFCFSCDEVGVDYSPRLRRSIPVPDGPRISEDSTARTDMYSPLSAAGSTPSKDAGLGPLRLLRAIVAAIPKDENLRELWEERELDAAPQTDSGVAGALRRAIGAAARKCFHDSDCEEFRRYHREHPAEATRSMQRYCAFGSDPACAALGRAIAMPHTVIPPRDDGHDHDDVPPKEPSN